MTLIFTSYLGFRLRISCCWTSTSRSPGLKGPSFCSTPRLQTAAMMRLTLLFSLLPCLLADSLRANLTKSSMAGCGASDEEKMGQLGGGNGAGSFPKKLSECGKRNFNVFFGFNENRFTSCVQSATGISSSCARCFVSSAKYGADNCKWSCFWGSWCGRSCLDCVARANAATKQCAGVAVPEASTC